MSAPQFTPGPWSVFPYYYQHDNGEQWRLIGTGQYDTVAEVRHGNEDLPGNVDANARLIAAAPDLLESCHHAETAIGDLQSALHDVLNLLDYARCSDGNLPIGADRKLLAANELMRSRAAEPIRAALAKAVGQ